MTILLSKRHRQRQAILHLLRERLRRQLPNEWTGQPSIKFDDRNQVTAVTVTLPAALLPSKYINGVTDVLAETAPGEWDIRSYGTKIIATRKPPPKPAAPPRVVHSELAQVMADATARFELCVGQQSDGTWLTMPLDHVAAMVVGGKTGSGKSYSLRSILAPFIGCDAVQFAIINGSKKHFDWNPFEPRTFAHLRVGGSDDEMARAVLLLQSLDEELNRRFDADKDFWDTGPTIDTPLLIVIIDECQKFLDLTYTPEAKKRVQQCRAVIRRLTATGRAAGFLTVLATQKPTAESIPTEIRDNAELRLCYSVMNRQAAQATLGDGWAEEGLSPVKQPNKGACVCYSDANGFQQVQSPDIGSDRIKLHATRYAYLCKDPCVLDSAVIV